MKKQPKSLQEFYQDIETRNNVHLYLIEFLKEEGVRMLMDKEDTKGIAEAKEFIDKAFENMDLLFSPKVGKKEQVNEAR